MRKWLFPAACLVTAALAAFLLWAWSTDYFLRRDCARHDGLWNAETRACVIRTRDRSLTIAALPRARLHSGQDFPARAAVRG